MSDTKTRMRMSNGAHNARRVIGGLRELADKLEKSLEEVAATVEDESKSRYEKYVALAHLAERISETATTSVNHPSYLRTAVALSSEAATEDFLETYKDKIE